MDKQAEIERIAGEMAGAKNKSVSSGYDNPGISITGTYKSDDFRGEATIAVNRYWPLIEAAEALQHDFSFVGQHNLWAALEPFQERKVWQRGDVLKRGRTVGVIYLVREEGYDIVIGPGRLYSETNWPSDIFLQKWEKIDALGGNCHDSQITNSVYVKGA